MKATLRENEILYAITASCMNGTVEIEKKISPKKIEQNMKRCASATTTDKTKSHEKFCHS